jgi:hypothetical protein
MHKINYIKNEYLIDLSQKGEGSYNEAAKKIGGGIYETSGAYLADAESPTDVASRQIILMDKVKELFDSKVSIIKGDLAVREESITGKPPTFAITP